MFFSEGSPIPSENHLIFPFVFPLGKSFIIAGGLVVGFHSYVFSSHLSCRWEKMNWSDSVEISEPMSHCGVGSPYICVWGGSRSFSWAVRLSPQLLYLFRFFFFLS